MDLPAPVATQIRPPDPMQGINTYSAILGLKQQENALQLQRQQMYQASQDAVERQNIASEDWSKYTKPDGSYDVDAATKRALQLAPTKGPAQAAQLAQLFEAGSQAKSAFLKLTGEKVDVARNAVSSWGADPKASVGDLTKSLASLEDNYNDPQIRRFSESFLNLINKAPPNAQKQMALHLGRQGVPAAQTSAPVFGSNAAGQIVNRPAYGTDLSLAGGANPSAPMVAAQTKDVTGGVDIDLNRANEIGQKAQSARTTIDLTNRVDQLAGLINSGKGAKYITEALNNLGIGSVAEARTELQKDLGQLRGAVAGRAGSDSRAAEILEGYPTDTTPEHTIHAAMDFIRGSARMDMARGAQLDSYKANGSLRGFSRADDFLSRNTSPLMHEYMSLKPEQRAEFYRRNFKTAREAQEFKDEVMHLKGNTKIFGNE